VTVMQAMFFQATSFGGDISKWDVSSVTDMAAMFYRAELFNCDLAEWNVSSVAMMTQMFNEAASFNGDVSKWDVSHVTSMYGMFEDAASFNGDISKWDVSRVTTMGSMFRLAISFSADISQWDVSSVVDMDYMFRDAALFDKSLCGAAWVHSEASKSNMFTGSSGNISQTLCTLNTERPTEYMSRRPIPDRELVVHAPNTMNCPKCGTFQKSGRVSCCAPGGAWFKNCGRPRNRNVDHMWFEGVAACKRKFKSNTI